jgi:tetratricopeptide (TPR) repeat protein
MFFQSGRVFLKQDELVMAFQVHGLGPATRDQAEIRYTFYKNGLEYHSLARKVSEYRQSPNFVEKVALTTFPPAHYRVEASLFVGDQEILSESEEFDITHLPSIARPWIYTRLLAETQDPVYDYIIGTQLFRSGMLEEAQSRIEQAYRSNPENVDYALNLARLYMTSKNYEGVESVLKPFLSREEAPLFEVYFILGKAYQYQGQLAQAIEVFDQAIQHHGLSTNLLNAIGECYFQLDNIPEALAAWEKSLEINPEQPDIQKNVNTLKEQNNDFDS